MNQLLRIVFLGLFLNSPVVFHAQNERVLRDSLVGRMEVYGQKGSETSLYLKCSKDIYFTGEDLWFSAFALQGQSFSLSDQDQVLYVQLHHVEGDSAVWKEMFPLSKGLSGGHIYLPHTLSEGNYLLKGYTAHSYFFPQSHFYAMAPIQIVREPGSIKNYAQLGQSVSPRKGEEIRLDLFPESGNLISGLSNVVGFKGVNKEGLPVSINGLLLKNGVPLLTIKTAHSGMGRFTFTPEAKAQYAVRLDSHPDSLFKLPAIAEEGVVLHLQKNEGDSLIFKITAKQQQSKTIFLRIQVRGMLQSIAQGTLKDSLTINIPVKGVPAGIAEATLFDEALRPLAGRLVFLHPQSKLNIRFSGVKELYTPKEGVSLKIKTTDEEGKPIPAVLSLRVYDQLFQNKRNVGDIGNYYQLSTQLSNPVYDPSYYFDTANRDRKDALDLLLLTKRRETYTWNEEQVIQHTSLQKAVLSDSLEAVLLPVNKSKKLGQPVSLILFNYNRSTTQVATADGSGRFFLTPGNLSIGRRFFIKYLSDQDYTIRVANPFDSIRAVEKKRPPVSLLSEKGIVLEMALGTGRLQYGKMLQEVVVQAKGGRGFGDGYLGYLDSIAKFEGNTDYVGQCGGLNCPACGTGTKPVEGRNYTELIEPRRSQVHTHPFSFTSRDVRQVSYHYPKYTEEELLKKFKMAITNGLYQEKKFSSPNYDREDNTVADYRNTLYWNPTLTTDEKGEATIRFFCSDIRGRFIIVAEGVSGSSLFGTTDFHFGVK